jgi:hypothetical protein
MSIFYYSPPTSSKRQEFEKFKEFKKRSREPEFRSQEVLWPPPSSNEAEASPRPDSWILAPGSSNFSSFRIE